MISNFQMADPLTALIHAVQVMNFLKTLILKKLREREEAIFAVRALDSCSESSSDKDEAKSSKPSERDTLGTNETTTDIYALDKVTISKFLPDTEQSLGRDEEKKSEIGEENDFVSKKISPVCCGLDATEDECSSRYVGENVESEMYRLNFRKGVRKLCRHPVLQLSRSTKKAAELDAVNSEGREAWA